MQPSKRTNNETDGFWSFAAQTKYRTEQPKEEKRELIKFIIACWSFVHRSICIYSKKQARYKRLLVCSVFVHDQGLGGMCDIIKMKYRQIYVHVLLIDKNWTFNEKFNLSTWQCRFSYHHWSQVTLSLVSTWMGDWASVVGLLLSINPRVHAVAI